MRALCSLGGHTLPDLLPIWLSRKVNKKELPDSKIRAIEGGPSQLSMEIHTARERLHYV